MSKYVVDGSDLTSLADAIREKTGETGGLTFPTGMVNAIDGISDGDADAILDGSIVDLQSNASVIKSGVCSGDTYLESVNLPSATKIGASAFQNCTALANVYFNSDISWSSVLTNPFNQMLYGCSNVTVHFKSSMQSAISALSSAIAGFGGSDTVILYDL